MFSADVVRAIHPDFKEERKAGPAPAQGDGGWFGLTSIANLVFKVPESGGALTSLPVRGIESDMPVRFAPKGGAVPGERIVGIRTPGEGITIYPIHSPALMAYDDRAEQWLDVRWNLDSERKALYPTQIVVTVINEPGALGIVSTTIGEAGANIDNIVLVPHAADFREMRIDLEVWDIKHLNTVLSQLRAKSVVNKVERLSG